MEVLRRTDLSKMHADLPIGDQTMRLVCNVDLAGLKQRERTLGGRPARDSAPGVFFFFFFFFFFLRKCAGGRLGHAN